MSRPRFSDLQDVNDLARAAGVAATDIEAYVEADDQAAFYQLIQIPKRGRKRAGQFRVVHKAVREWLRQLHRAVALMAAGGAAPGPHVQGFVAGRSIRSNAQQHLGKAFVLHGDISGFFDAITTDQVRLALLALGAGEDMARLLARACTIDGLLRQGTRCAPALANLVCRQLDADLLALAGEHGSVYTRYADDLTFSGDAVPASEAVARVLGLHGFKLRDGRCQVQIRGCSQFVTGLHVFDGAQPRLPRRLKRRLRLVLHWIEKVGMDAHFAHRARRPLVDDPLALEGLLRFVQSVEPALVKTLRAQFRSGSQKAWKERNGP